MTEAEIERMKAEIKQDTEDQAEDAEAAGAEGAGPGPMEAGGQEGAENEAPTAEGTIANLGIIRDLVLEEDKKEVITRIIEKQTQKAHK